MHVDLAFRAIEGMSEGKRILEDWMSSRPAEDEGARPGQEEWLAHVQRRRQAVWPVASSDGVAGAPALRTWERVAPSERGAA